MWREFSRESLQEVKQEFASSGLDVQQYAMALEVILYALGPEWWKRNCLQGSERPDRFFSSSGNVDVDMEENRQIRMLHLGHCLYALKDCRGYSTFLRGLQSRDLGPAFFELWVASRLQDSEFEVEFVEASGVTGEDYDLLAHKDGERVCVEAKARYPGPLLTAKTLENTLVKARRQLPKEGPGVIFVSIPADWAWVEDAETLIGSCIADFFRKSSRVNRVVILHEHWVQVPEGRGLAFHVREYENPSPKALMAVGPFVTAETDVSWVPSFW